MWQVTVLDYDYTLEVGMYRTWLDIRANGNVGIEALSMSRVVNILKSLIEEIIEAFVYSVSLAQNNSMSL